MPVRPLDAGPAAGLTPARQPPQAMAPVSPGRQKSTARPRGPTTRPQAVADGVQVKAAKDRAGSRNPFPGFSHPRHL
jgi:hypothetical protein